MAKGGEVGNLGGFHVILKCSAKGSANGGVVHEKSGWPEKAACQRHHNWVQAEVLVGAVRWRQAGCGREGEDGVFTEGTICLELNGAARDVDEDGGDAKRMLGNDELG